METEKTDAENLEELLKKIRKWGDHCTTIFPPDIKKGRWCGCCYESELDSFYGKGYE